MQYMAILGSIWAFLKGIFGGSSKYILLALAYNKVRLGLKIILTLLMISFLLVIQDALMGDINMRISNLLNQTGIPSIGWFMCYFGIFKAINFYLVGLTSNFIIRVGLQSVVKSF